MGATTFDWTRGRTLGRGSSATVSLATASPSGTLFAVKSTHLDRSDFLQREQRILSRLHSPRIVSYLGHDVTHEKDQLSYNLFIEYVSGGTIADAGRLDEPAVRSYTRDILQGLAYLHSNRLVHCDIKGRNVLVGSDGAKIADFGCARWADEDSKLFMGGTPVFMAPEVARGEEQGFPADVWAVGCTVIEMATGRPPWVDVNDPVSALYRIAFSGDVPEFPSWLSDHAKDFLSKCLRREPKERWTAKQLLKHPFFEEKPSCCGKIREILSGSPKSTLDHGFWDSLDDEPMSRDQTQIDISPNPVSERIPITPTPNWTWEDSWVTVRTTDEEGEIAPVKAEDQIQADELTGASISISIWATSREEGVSSSTSSSVTEEEEEEEEEGFLSNSVFNGDFVDGMSRNLNSYGRSWRGFFISSNYSKFDVSGVLIFETPKISVFDNELCNWLPIFNLCSHSLVYFWFFFLSKQGSVVPSLIDLAN